MDKKFLKSEAAINKYYIGWQIFVSVAENVTMTRLSTAQKEMSNIDLYVP